ncbi:MAG TPA: hypothetical protein VKU90_08705 [Caulobacteraceae bacterium]|nr:hypothetical protein [Caulobacteraceae bacterium]
MVRQTTVVFGAAALLAACAPHPRKEGPAPPPAPYRSGPLLVGAWGAGPIRAGTPFAPGAVERLFPGAAVRETVLPVAGDTTTRALIVSVGGTDWLEIDDGSQSNDADDDDAAAPPAITAVRAMAGPVRGPHGEGLGLAWPKAGFDLSECDAGGERDRDTVFCARPGEGTVIYQFGVRGWDSEEMPSSAAMRAGGYLKAIIWAPNGTGGS